MEVKVSDFRQHVLYHWRNVFFGQHTERKLLGRLVWCFKDVHRDLKALKHILSAVWKLLRRPQVCIKHTSEFEGFLTGEPSGGPWGHCRTLTTHSIRDFHCSNLSIWFSLSLSFLTPHFFIRMVVPGSKSVETSCSSPTFPPVCPWERSNTVLPNIHHVN